MRVSDRRPSDPQYAVPVTKYDRKGYKARPRQLLLTANSAVIVEEAKLKQRIEYATLRGQRSTDWGGCVMFWVLQSCFFFKLAKCKEN